MIRNLLIAAALVLAAGIGAQAEAPRNDLQLFNDISRAVVTYSRFTVFDDVSATVDNGTVTLHGRVTMPYKVGEIGRRVARVADGRPVKNEIKVLPVSFFDDQLRFRVARAIYGNDVFEPFASMSNPPIHIVVENGRVTLTGVVYNDFERTLARTLANTTNAFSVKDDLRTDAEMKAQFEQMG